MTFFFQHYRTKRSTRYAPAPGLFVGFDLSVRRKRRMGIWISSFLVLCLVLWLFIKIGGWILNWVLVYETEPAFADVVLVESYGGILDQSAELFHAGKVKRILITTYRPDKFRAMQSPVSLFDLIREKLNELGISPEAVHHFPHEPTSMLDRQFMLRDWIRSHDCRSYLVFSGRYSSRLVKMRHEDTFPEGGVSLVIVPTDGKGVWRKQWLGIQNTLIRMLFWEMVYRPQIRRHNLPEQTPPETTP